MLTHLGIRAFTVTFSRAAQVVEGFNTGRVCELHRRLLHARHRLFVPGGVVKADGDDGLIVDANGGRGCVTARLLRTLLIAPYQLSERSKYLFVLQRLTEVERARRRSDRREA